jgi:type IV pilus assembly protein PilM
MRIPNPKINLNLNRRGGGGTVGLDVQPGFIAAVQARSNSGLLAERARAQTLPAEVVRDGEVADAGALSDALRELFHGSGLGRRVRVGIANQRTVLRILELPPLTDRKELAAAVTFQAQEQVPMPLHNAVLDFHPLGIVDTPAGPRQRVVLVAAQRDMVERLLSAVRGAGLIPEGLDLSAFALIRSLFRPGEDAGRVLYLNVDGLTNLAIAEGTMCRFTRVVGSGLEGMASDLAVRLGVPVASAHELISAVDLDSDPVAETPLAEAPVAGTPVAGLARPAAEGPREVADGGGEEPADDHAERLAQLEAREREMSFEELAAAPASTGEGVAETSAARLAREVLESGVRELSGEVRNSLDFHRSQEGGGEVSHVVLSGAAQDIPGFARCLQETLGVEVRGESVQLAQERLAAGVSPHRLAVATGLSVTEAPR